ALDFYKYKHPIQHPQPLTAILQGNQGRQPSRSAQGSDEFIGVGIFLIATAPILIAETSAERGDRCLDFFLTVRQLEIHDCSNDLQGSIRDDHSHYRFFYCGGLFSLNAAIPSNLSSLPTRTL